MSCRPQHRPLYPQIRLYQNWLRETRGLSFADYDALWRWSTSDLDAFWQSIWDYFDLQSPTPHSAVLASNTMPGAQWFPGAQVNYVQQVLRHVQPAHAAGMPAVISRNEQGLQRELSWPELQRQVAALALHLRAQGVAKGDRVAAYLPNIPEAIVAFLACASLGAIWSICAPDMGTHAVLDRFKQIAPKALIAVDGVHYAGKDIDRREVLQELRQGLPSVQHVVLVPNLDTSIKIADTADYTSVTARNDADTAAFSPSGCRSTIRCGSSTPAAPPACPSPSSTAMAAWCWWPCSSRPCTTTSAAATSPTAGASATTGTAPRAG
jgi:acetoacetyl-CoA synthetase